jgi:osmotically inducible lipoprotein OsmB
MRIRQGSSGCLPTHDATLDYNLKQQEQRALTRLLVRGHTIATDVQKGENMVRVLTILLAGATLLTATGCADMTARQRNTALGAGIGGLAGAALIGGPGATLGGAALGGLVGNVSTR